MRRRALALGQAARGARFTCAGRHWLTMNKPPPCRGLACGAFRSRLARRRCPPPLSQRRAYCREHGKLCNVSDAV